MGQSRPGEKRRKTWNRDTTSPDNKKADNRNWRI